MVPVAREVLVFTLPVLYMQSVTLPGNPIIPGWYADPEIHFFENRFYIYPSTSMAFDRQVSFEAFSSHNLADWKSEGEILRLKDVAWSTNRAAWAPSCATKNGRYYLYFAVGDGVGIGVAEADSPSGPFRDVLGAPLIGDYPFGAQPIDPHCFIDDDGTAYLYFGGHSQAVVGRLNEDMISFSGELKRVTPEKYVEGPFMAKRGNRYYFMWSEGDWTASNYQVAYAIADSPWGPFKREEVILRGDLTIGLAPGHHSVLQLPGTDDWIICYHRRPPCETDPQNRVTCLEPFYFESNGRIRPVIMTESGLARIP